MSFCCSLGNGITSAYLPIYHYVFLDYSQPLGALMVELKHDMFGKSDLKFIETMYRVSQKLFFLFQKCGEKWV